LQQIKAKHRNRKIIIILDNASIHTCKKVKQWLNKNKNICLMHLPTYSPEYNPIEQVWKWIKSVLYGISPINNGAKEIIARFRKICWHWLNERMVNPISVGLGIWNLLL